jgi:hypothetical protein
VTLGWSSTDVLVDRLASHRSRSTRWSVIEVVDSTNRVAPSTRAALRRLADDPSPLVAADARDRLGDAPSHPASRTWLVVTLRFGRRLARLGVVDYAVDDLERFIDEDDLAREP